MNGDINPTLRGAHNDFASSTMQTTVSTRVGSFDFDVHSTEQATHGGSAWHVWIDLVISQILGKTTMVGVASELDGRRWRATRSSEMVRLPGSVTIYCTYNVALVANAK